MYARLSAQYDWIQSKVCEYSSEPPSSFECDDTLLAETDTPTTQDITAVTKHHQWTTITQEDFTSGLDLIDKQESQGTLYKTAYNRQGVVRINNGGVLKSKQISLANSPFTMLKIAFSLYSMNLEHSDYLCLDYELDGGATKGEKCWRGLHAFDNGQWYDDMDLVITASSANNSMKFSFRVDGNDAADDVLVDSVRILGQA